MTLYFETSSVLVDVGGGKMSRSSPFGNLPVGTGQTLIHKKDATGVLVRIECRSADAAAIRAIPASLGFSATEMTRVQAETRSSDAAFEISFRTAPVLERPQR